MEEDTTSFRAESELTDQRGSRKAAILKSLIIFLTLLAFPALWKWTPLNDWINLETILAWQESMRNNPAAFYLVVGAYLLGSLVLFPVTILNVATILAFGPIRGNIYGLFGWLAGAAMGYGIGRALGRQLVRTVARSRLARLVQPAGRHGFLTVLTLRVFPVAPFTLINFFVGATGIRFRDFFLASIVGRIPGIILLTLAGAQVENLLRQPDVIGVVLLGLTLTLVPFALAQLSKRVVSRHRRPRGDSTF